MLLTKIIRQISLRHATSALSKLNETQYWPREKIREFQQKKIQMLLKHAFAHVPYYRGVAASLGANPEDFKTRQDLQQLPILTKDIIRQNFNQLLADNIAPMERIANATGGSTGEPLHFFQDRQFAIWADAARMRGWYHVAGCNYWDPCAVLWGAMHEVKEDFSLRERARDYIKTGEIWLNAFNLSDERKVEFTKLCHLLRPKLIRGYFSAVKDFAGFLRESKLSFPPVNGVILCAETVDEASRADIEKIFEAPAYNTYGGRELSLIAMECQHKNGLHEISENNYVEFEPIELHGHADAGNLLITNLNNYVMPFIRYRIGDIGIPSHLESCACGRGLPLIKRVIGRTTEVLTFTGGVKIAGEMFIHLMKDFPIEEYQFIQKAIDRVVLRCPAAKFPGELLQQKIKETYSGYLPKGVILDFEKVGKIEKTATGKFRFVLREER